MATKRYGIFSDIHSNVDAFMAVMDDMAKNNVTHPICLGDVVGYNAAPRESLKMVLALGCPVIMGNHDEMVAGLAQGENFNALAGEGIAHSKKNLSSKYKTMLRQFPMQKRIDHFTIVHASLDDPHHWNYVNSDLEAESSFTYQHTRLCFVGHTHIPKVFRRDKHVHDRPPAPSVKLERNCRYLINVGSVGQPRDRDWRASYVIYTPSQELVEFRRLEYDLQKAQDRILRAGLPEPLATRLALGA
ncbi:MAG: metallophosphoesterase family protein [Candidatus Methylacidiphilales bacterium]